MARPHRRAGLSCMEPRIDLILSICLGIGLSAACGFRVFIPLFVASGAAFFGYLQPSAGFEWLGSETAFWTFATAALLEVLAYFVPWFDHLMDSIAGPAALVAGTLLMAASLTDMGPWLKWTLALIAGGGSAAVVQGSSMLARGFSTTLTGGAGNFLVSAAEAGGALVLSLLAITLPVVAAGAVVVIAVSGIRRGIAALKRKRKG